MVIFRQQKTFGPNVIYFVLGTLVIVARLTYSFTKTLLVVARLTYAWTKTLLIVARLIYSLTKTLLIVASSRLKKAAPSDFSGPPGFYGSHRGSTRVPPGFHRGFTGVPPGCSGHGLASTGEGLGGIW